MAFLICGGVIIDVLLPSAVFLITLIVVFTHTKVQGRFRSFIGERQLRLREVILLVAAMSILVAVLVLVPSSAIIVVFLFVYSAVLFLFTCLLIPKYHLAVLTPAIFVALYLLYRGTLWWNLYLFNLFAVVFSVLVSVYMGSLFSWKTTTLFVALLTIMDIIQVFGTKFMVAYGERMIQLSLPVVIILPTFPSQMGFMALGLGDIFLAGLLGIQTIQKFGKRFGLVCVTSIAVVFMVLEMLLLNLEVWFFPATVMVLAGWLVALGARQLHRLRFSGR